MISLVTSPGDAAAQATAVVPGVTQLAAGMPTSGDPTFVLAQIPLCPSEAASAAQIVRTSLQAPAPRAIVSVDPVRPPGTCNPYQLASNVHVDADSLYYVDNQGAGGSYTLWRKPRLANAGDPATPLVSFGASVNGAELLTFVDWIFLILKRPGLNDVMLQYNKQTGVLVNANVASGSPFQLSGMQVDERYLYWLNAGALWRNDLTNGNQVVIATGVTSYYDEGYDVSCNPAIGCISTARIVYGKGNQLWSRYNLAAATVIYTSPDAGATITGITRDGTRYYFFERRPVPGGGFARNDRLLRLPVGSATPALLYGPVNNGGPGFDSLHTDSTFLFFRDRASRVLYRLANDAAALPVYALRATAVEITQGAQTPTNAVVLVQGRRTFVRLHVRSDGATSVPGVDAVLNVFDTDTQTFLGTLRPKNRGGLVLVRTTPRRTALDDSFYFELPLDWTWRSRLSFSGVVNPTSVLVENDYANNYIQTGAYSFGDPPRLPLEVISWGYNFGNTFVLPGGLEDWNSLRWIERVYPLPSSGGSIGSPGFGLRSDSRLIIDDALATRVDQSDASCAARFTPATSMTPAVDNRNMCAADYVLGRIRAMRSAGDLPRGRYYYGSIARRPGVTPFVRGYAPGGDTIAMGPSLDLGAEQNYMAHEVGHLLGRDHPASGGGGVCGSQDAADPAYPHPRARIGGSTTAAADETALVGFDFGDNQYIVPAVKGASTRGDIMSYCSPYWISDYTYTGIYDRLSTVQPNGPEQAGAPIAGDWLIAEGSLTLATKSGAFHVVQRRDAVADAPAPGPGAWALQLRSAGGALLATHPFAPVPFDDEPGLASFSFVVPFEPGTRQLRIVETATGAIAATYAVSASPPAVSNLVLVGAPDPVTGIVTATWTADDPDGDALRFDLLLSRDGGLTFEPLVLSVAGAATDLDTAAWGGGPALLRVVASDGAQTAVTESAAFTVADKAPIVRISSPAPDTSLDWGQVVNFTATVDDPQDAFLSDSEVEWTNAYRTLGTGRAISVDHLEVGVNVVTVTATNAAGLTGQASVTVLVGDDLRLPGPRVSTLPAAIAFSVSGGETTSQSAPLEIVNPGGGVLQYIATSGETWISVAGTSSATGTAPQTVTVTVDPSVLPDAAVSVGEILVYNALDLGDVVAVAVSVAKGDVVGGNPFSDSDGDGIDDRSDSCPLVPGADPSDADGDGVGDSCDSCPYAANADQADAGGVGSGSAPDGIGDACQCGDANGDGRVTLADAVVIQRSLLVPATAVRTRPELCDVGGPASPATQDCTLADAVTIRRALLNPPSATIGQVCAPAVP